MKKGILSLSSEKQKITDEKEILASIIRHISFSPGAISSQKNFLSIKEIYAQNPDSEIFEQTLKEALERVIRNYRENYVVSISHTDNHENGSVIFELNISSAHEEIVLTSILEIDEQSNFTINFK